MAVFNAAEELYELCEPDGKPVAFTNMRLDRQTVPAGLYCYDVRDSDNCDGSCAEVKSHIMVNHWGTILCKSPFELDEYGSYYPQEDMNYKPPAPRRATPCGVSEGGGVVEDGYEKGRTSSAKRTYGTTLGHSLRMGGQYQGVKGP